MNANEKQILYDFLKTTCDYIDGFKTVEQKPIFTDDIKNLQPEKTKSTYPITGLDKEEFKAVKIKNPYLSPQHMRDKSCCLDAHIELKSGSKINIEMQNILVGDFTERTMYYWAKTLIEGFTRSANYSSLRKTICINIVNQPFKLTDKVQSIYKVLEIQECTILTELLEIQFLWHL